MEAAMSKKRLVPLVIGAGVVLALAFGYVAWNRTGTPEETLARKVQTAGSEEDRIAAARGLIQLGEPGRGGIKQIVLAGDAESNAMLAVALHEWFEAAPTGADRASMAAFLLDLQPRAGEAGQVAMFELVPTLIRGASPELLAQAREAVKTGMISGTADVACKAVRLAMRPEMQLKAEIVPALQRPEAAVRKEALLAIGPAVGDNAVIGTEDLFAWLHDADAEVRLVCEAALSTRGMEPEQIEAARKLTNTDVAERLSLLVQLRNGGKTLGEPGPWLERLSRDPEPAVRAGAARVACERKLPFAGWVRKLALEDPDAGVRQVAEFHRQRADIQQAGYEGN
jgi:HEAT repeat protein